MPSELYPSLQELDTMVDAIHELNNVPEEVLVPPVSQKSASFEASFIRPKTAQAIHAKTLHKAQEILKEFDKNYQCRTLNPLFVRYQGDKDVSLPIVILDRGEILVDHATVPDFVLHFFAGSRSILVTLCEINPDKMQDYWVVEKTLYEMQAPDALTLEQFERLYDITRYKVLQEMIVR